MPFFRRTHTSFYSGLKPGAKKEIKPGDPTDDFVNGNFEKDLENWTVINSRVSPGGVALGVEASILGCPIPAETDPYPLTWTGVPSTGQNFTPSVGFGDPIFSITIKNGGPPGKYGKYAYLAASNVWGTPGGYTVFGPALVSNNPVIAKAGDQVRLWWKAEKGGDAYNVFAYLIDPKQNCRSIILFDQSGGAVADTPWQEFKRVFEPGEDGNYYFVFIGGGFDYDRGTLCGGYLSVDEIVLDKAGTF